MPRLAASIVIQNSEAFVTKQFTPFVYGGEPSNIARIFSDLEVDELFIVNKTGGLQGHSSETLKRISDQTFIPLTYAGGVNTVEMAEAVSQIGFEKVLIDLGADSSSNLLGDLANSLGSSSVLRGFSFFDQHWVDWRTGIKHDEFEFEEAVVGAQRLGAGEIKITSISKDGMRSGPDLRLVERVARLVEVPLVYQGGVTSMAEVERLWGLGVDCVAVSSWFLVRPPHNAILVSYPRNGKR